MICHNTNYGSDLTATYTSAEASLLSMGLLEAIGNNEVVKKHCYITMYRGTIKLEIKSEYL